MSKGKETKNNPTNRNISKTVTYKTSQECKECKSQCARGLQYINIMSRPGAKGNGVPCTKKQNIMG